MRALRGDLLSSARIRPIFSAYYAYSSFLSTNYAKNIEFFWKNPHILSQLFPEPENEQCPQPRGVIEFAFFVFHDQSLYELAIEILGAFRRLIE